MKADSNYYDDTPLSTRAEWPRPGAGFDDGERHDVAEQQSQSRWLFSQYRRANDYCFDSGSHCGSTCVALRLLMALGPSN
jgi:hypothetical protein